jgi:hypothetical protein
MAILRCNSCEYIRETENKYIGKTAICPKCSDHVLISDTITYIKSLLQKNTDQNSKQEKDEIAELQIEENATYTDINIYNTDVLAHSDQYWPIDKWFRKHKIQTTINQDANNTTGFFDEIALLIGNDFHTLKFISDQIKYNQNKNYKNINIDLSKKSKKEITKIKLFCNKLYEYSFVSRYYDEPKEKKLRLVLQTAPKIRSFFNGDWMEWFIFMKLLEFFRDQGLEASCIRSLNIKFEDKQSNELDIFFIIKDNIPFCIECKSGEFRGDIDKYLKLRKKLKLSRQQFIICAFGLTDEQTQGLTTMYDLTFTNETNVIKYVEKMVNTSESLMESNDNSSFYKLK